MPVKYKIDVLSELKAHGYNTTRLRKEKIFGERVIQQFREGVLPSWAVVGKLCDLLGCDVSDLVEFIQDDSNGE